MALSETSFDLAGAAAVVETMAAVANSGARALATAGGVDRDQVVAYDLAHAGAAVEIARTMLGYAQYGTDEAAFTCAFVADAAYELATKVFGREAAWDVDAGVFDGARDFISRYRDPAFVASLASLDPSRHLDDDHELLRQTFRSFSDKLIAPHAEHVHRTNGDVPEEIIAGLGELGAFGLACPVEYGGASEGGAEYLAMVVATEELSRGSLGIGGSLITRPEILTRALLRGGTEEQKHRFLPTLATGEIMAAVAVTEPDYGSDVANIKVTATRVDGTTWAVNGTKTWSTFAARADVLMVIARTDPDRSLAHRGLSIFVVPKPRCDGHGFVLTQPTGGRLTGRPIDTIGYRGMHSYELSFEDWRVDHANLIGEDGGIGRGFYYQMEGFENGRIQTAARALGVMQAAYEAAREYSAGRIVFAKPISDYQLTQVKLARMAFLIQACRQFTYEVAARMSAGGGAMEASMVKAYVCKAAEWVAREALQIHGGYGYAEEYAVSRLYVDARVLSIFEGADETLCVRIIAKKLVEQAKAGAVS
ncbi:MAG: acyl-CoA dehydrogenase family protein [Acidimicrobiia bacterium]